LKASAMADLLFWTMGVLSVILGVLR